MLQIIIIFWKYFFPIFSKKEKKSLINPRLGIRISLFVWFLGGLISSPFYLSLFFLCNFCNSYKTKMYFSAQVLLETVWWCCKNFVVKPNIFQLGHILVKIYQQYALSTQINWDLTARHGSYNVLRINYNNKKQNLNFRFQIKS